jgi:hypothetical protein
VLTHRCRAWAPRESAPLQLAQCGAAWVLHFEFTAQVQPKDEPFDDRSVKDVHAQRLPAAFASWLRRRRQRGAVQALLAAACGRHCQQRLKRMVMRKRHVQPA